MVRTPFYECNATISFPNGDLFEFERGEAAKTGASSLVYRVYRLDSNKKRTTEHLLKEFYPNNVQSLYRDRNGVLHVRDQSEAPKFHKELERFRQGYTQQINMRNDIALKNEICDIQEIYQNAYGTEFIRMPTYRGSTYSEIEDRSLVDLLQRIRAITQVVARCHEKGFLLLDIKPDNIFVDPENSTFVQLFDFDSIVSVDDKAKKDVTLSSTEKWSAPEFKYANANQVISYATDIFSIGEILFFKLMGRHSDPSDRDPGATYFTDSTPNRGLLAGADPEIRSQLTRFFQYTIANSHAKRWPSTDRVLEALDHMLATLKKSKAPAPQKAAAPVDTNNISKGLSKLSLSIVFAAVMICAAIAFLTFGRSNGPVSTSQDRDPAAAESSAQEVLSDTERTEPDAVNGSSASDVEDPTMNIPAEGSAQTPSSAVENQSSQSAAYSIDTVASGLTGFRSMVIDHSGTVYYINGDTLCRSDSTAKLDLSSAFGQSLENCYLAHDPYNNIVYLISGRNAVRIFDVSAFDHASEVLNADNCPALSQFTLEYHSGNSTCLRQIVVLSDGSLLLPGDYSRPFRVNPNTKTAAEFSQRVYYTGSSGYYTKLIGNDLITIRAGDSSATVTLLSGASSTIHFAMDAPDNEGAAFGTEAGIISYAAGTGVCLYRVDGSCSTLVSQKDIRVADYESLDSVNIWSFAANGNGAFAFYDNSLKAIRCLTAVAQG